MRFFFPDAHDYIDPGFDFEREAYSPRRQRQRDDRYAHEVFPEPPFDGLLVSRAIVEGRGGDEDKKYTDAQRHRLLRVGAREFFRLGDRPLLTMGDSGAFSYLREAVPPLTVDQALDFYEACGFDWGVSVDHVILGYDADADVSLPGVDLVPDEWRKRQDVTLELAAQFLRRHVARNCRPEPVGAAQGWSPRSYAHCVEQLQKMGYRRIGLGGMVALKSHEVLACLEAVDAVRRPETQLHLFGLTRCELAARFRGHGVASFDSTSPLKQAFMDDRDNYYAPGRTYTAVRVPQVDKSPKLKKRVLAGEIDQAEAIRLERGCLKALDAYDKGETGLDGALASLADYERLYDGRKSRAAEYREVLADRPWRDCPCVICRAIGVQVVVFRGAERNRRRGFHNLWVTYRRLRQALAGGEDDVQSA
jgi:hypothetical protein